MSENDQPAFINIPAPEMFFHFLPTPTRAEAHKIARMLLQYYEPDDVIFYFRMWLEKHDIYEGCNQLTYMSAETPEQLVSSEAFQRLFIKSVVHQTPDGKWTVHRIGLGRLKKHTTPEQNSIATQPPSANRATINPGGRPHGLFRQAIEYLFQLLLESGKTGLLLPGNEDAFLEQLRQRISTKNEDPYIAERIKSVWNLNQ